MTVATFSLRLKSTIVLLVVHLLINIFIPGACRSSLESQRSLKQALKKSDCRDRTHLCTLNSVCPSLRTASVLTAALRSWSNVSTTTSLYCVRASLRETVITGLELAATVAVLQSYTWYVQYIVIKGQFCGMTSETPVWWT